MSRITLFKIIFTFYFMLFGIACLPVFAGDVQITEKSERGITFEFQLTNWHIESESVAGMPYFRVGFDKCIYDAKPGDPLLPSRLLIFALPPKARVSMQVIRTEMGDQINGKPLPTPTITQEKPVNLSYVENEVIYSGQADYPENLVQISPESSLRDNHVIVLRIFPFRFSPAKNLIQCYKRFLIRLNFIGGIDVISDWQFEGSDNAYSRIVVNSDQAGKWRQPGTDTSLSKKSRLKSGTGEWYKIFIQDDGIYKVTGADLERAGILLSAIDPARLKIYNNGGRALPISLDAARPDSLIENAIFVDDGDDGSFRAEDYFLFYGKSVNNWQWDEAERVFRHYMHRHTQQNVYWLNWHGGQPGKRMKEENSIPNQSATLVTDFLDHLYVEQEYKNLLNSGIHWVGNYFSNSTLQRNYQFDLSDAVQNKETVVRVKVAGVSQGRQSFRLYLNETFIGQIPEFYSSSGRLINIRMKEFSASMQSGLLDGYNKVTLEYIPFTETALAYLDWIELSFFRELTARDNELFFCSPDSVGLFQYQVNDFSSDQIEIFDISEYDDVKRMTDWRWQNSVITFVDSCSSNVPKKYAAINTANFRKPVQIERDHTSSLRDYANGADYIIITYDDFYDAALGLKSLRENFDTLKTEVVKISQIYDEFSWGLPDVVAIRDFIRYTFYNWKIRPSYVLLFGDGDFDYKNILSPIDPNWIPTFETAELDEGSSRARDDWFVCVAGNDNLMDMAIGRIPVQNPDEAFKVVEKIVDYETHPDIGDWCNTITMVADDEFESGGNFDNIDHIPDAETIAEDFIPKSYDVKKVYLTEYPAVYDASVSGIRKPAAQQALIERINHGNLIVNFIGHGNERVWAHENVLNISDDLPRIRNGSRQAFWIAATCNFGRFDNPMMQSFAEELVNLSGRGAIAVFSACRLAIPYANVRLNEAIYEHLFKSSHKSIRIGDVVTAAKNSVGNNENDQFFHLLGDPALRIIRPSCLPQISDYSPDSMKALCKMNVTGTVNSLDELGSDMQGTILLKVFDSKKDRIYQVREGEQYHYKLPGNTIFRGKVSVTHGEYSSEFMIPKDITYGGTDGRLSIFFQDDRMYGAGFKDGIPVGGTELNFSDTEGPKIIIDFEGQDFMSGGFVEPNAVLNISVRDELSGVNIIGDIGHKISMVLDEEEDKKVDLTDYFQYDMDSYISGNIVYSLEDLEKGNHIIRVKAWDNFNNSAEVSAEFTVVSPDKLVIRDVLNYPNPFSSNTEFTFWMNQSCEVDIRIFTISGRLVRKLDHLWAVTGFNRFAWDGRDRDGDPLANGVYLYQIKASGKQGSKSISAQEIERCVILR